jgi:hypothetical protein
MHDDLGMAQGGPIAIMDEAYRLLVAEKRILAGSSTAAVVTMERRSGMLKVANLGDSVVAVVRDSELLAATVRVGYLRYSYARHSAASVLFLLWIVVLLPL